MDRPRGALSAEELDIFYKRITPANKTIKLFYTRKDGITGFTDIGSFSPTPECRPYHDHPWSDYYWFFTNYFYAFAFAEQVRQRRIIKEPAILQG